MILSLRSKPLDRLAFAVILQLLNQTAGRASRPSGFTFQHTLYRGIILAQFLPAVRAVRHIEASDTSLFRALPA